LVTVYFEESLIHDDGINVSRSDPIDAMIRLLTPT